MNKPTVPQISLFRRQWFSMTREDPSASDIAKLKTRNDASIAISKLNEIKQRWRAEMRAEMEKVSPDERIKIAASGSRRRLTEDERKEVLGE